MRRGRAAFACEVGRARKEGKGGRGGGGEGVGRRRIVTSSAVDAAESASGSALVLESDLACSPRPGHMPSTRQGNQGRNESREINYKVCPWIAVKAVQGA